VRSIAKTTVLSLCLCTAAWPQQGSRWIDVPFIQQPREGCGAASVAMVMKFWQERQGNPDVAGSDVEHIQETLFHSQAHGIYASDLKSYLDRQGFDTHVFRGDGDLLQHHIEHGRPLIVALQPSSGRLLHYVVVAGVDRGEHVVFVNDPAQRKLLKIDSRAFKKEWQAAGNWTLLALPRSDTH
jgi:ABC-type bacteriocin/lantibiotic exporter with double-glycine peptidase domain